MTFAENGFPPLAKVSFGEMSQLPGALDMLADIIRGDAIDVVIEIGSASGNLARWLSMLAINHGPDYQVHSFDVVEVADNSGHFANFHVGDVFDFSRSSGARTQVIDLIDSARRPLLLCDGGNKIREVNTFAPLLPPGGIVAVHDFALTRRDFEVRLRGQEIWPCCECVLDDIVAAVGTWQPLYERTLPVAWGMWRRTV